jgi:hypothetical protein
VVRPAASAESSAIDVEGAWRAGDDERGLDMAACESLAILGLRVTRRESPWT